MTSPRPLFHALADSIERQIRDGAYKVGEKLPSIREIAAVRNYGKNTVISAFELLVARGLVEPRHGAGFFVREVAQPRQDMEPEGNRALHRRWTLSGC